MRKLLNLFKSRRARMEEDLSRELRYHLDRRTTDLQNSGLSETEASRQASIDLGGVAQIQEEVRETWFWLWLDNLQRDTRYAVRVLLRSPGFTAAAVLSLALGIGANAAIFSILDALMLRSLPVSDPQKLVVITRQQVSAPYPLFTEFRDHTQTLEGVLAFRSAAMRFSTGNETERVNGVLVSGTYFDVLGVRPIAGTTIAKEDDVKPGSGGWRGPVAVLSYSFWQRRFGGQPSVVGSRILLNDQPFIIAGVAPPGFEGTEVGETADVFAPMTLQPVLIPGLGNSLAQPRSNWIRMFGRLKPDVDVRQAEAELTGLLRRYNEAILQGNQETVTPERRRAMLEQRITLPPGSAGISQLRRQYSKPLWVLMTVMGLVLLIACSNVANLLLSRAAARRREIGIRLGLGAARSRLISQLLLESLLIAVAGAASGLLLAGWLRNMLLSYLPADQNLSAPLDLQALFFTLALAAGSAILFGLAPAFQSTKVDVALSLKGEQSVAVGPVRGVFRKGLIVFQMSLSFLLLIGAALFLRSLNNLMSLDTGFARENVLVASLDVGGKIPSGLMETVRAIPGVQAAGIADSPPLGTNTGWTVFVPGYTPAANDPRDSPSVGFISPGYLETMNIPLLAGRAFDEQDLSQQRDVMIVNESFAKQYFEGENPVGRRIGTTDGVYKYEIIGVAKDGKYTGLREEATRMMYVPYRPGPWAGRIIVHLRSAGNPLALTSALRKAVRDLDSRVLVFNVHTAQDELERSLLKERLVGTVTALFGVLALTLAGVGLYGLMSYGVARRTREFGIRMAIGAKAESIVALVLREAMWLLIGGIVTGLAAAWALGQVVSSLLFGLAPTDPVSISVSAAVLAGAALIAVWIPARRASKVDPTVALRDQ